jgi:hypothetical protein
MPKWNVTLEQHRNYWDVEAATEEEAIDMAMNGNLASDATDDEYFATIVDDDEAEAAEMFAPAIEATAEAIEEYRKESEAEFAEAPWKPVSTSYSPQMMQHLHDQRKLRVVE